MCWVKFSAIFRRTQELRSFSQVQPHYGDRGERGQSIRIEDFSWELAGARSAGGIWGGKEQFSGSAGERRRADQVSGMQARRRAKRGVVR